MTYEVHVRWVQPLPSCVTMIMRCRHNSLDDSSLIAATLGEVSCINEGVHNVIGADLSALRSALRKVGLHLRALLSVLPAQRGVVHSSWVVAGCLAIQAADACHQDQSEVLNNERPTP
eukprot:4455750-Amphidinium_carterae.1